MAEQEAPATTTANPGAPSRGGARSALPQFALDAADHQIDKVGGALTSAADAIDGAFEQGGVPGGEVLQRYVGDAARRLRDLGERAGDLDADDLIVDAQRAGAARPALAIAIGAAAGALLAVAFVRTAPRTGKLKPQSASEPA